MNHVIFDVDLSGHHTEYIKHLVSYIITKKKKNDNFYFVVHKNFFSQCKDILEVARGIDNIVFTEVPEAELDGRKVNNRIKRSFNNFALMNRYAVSLKADIVYLMHLNVFQIALGLKKYRYKIRGILFMQFTNMKVNSLRSFYYYLRRYFPFIVMNFQKKNLDRIFVLNDSHTAELLNQKYKTNIYKSLPDPINYVEPEKDVNIRDVYNIHQDAVILFHFGALADRKGTIETVQSLAYLPQNKHYALLLVGKSKDADFIEVLKGEIEKVSTIANIQCFWDNNFVSDQRVSTLFSQSDIILMPYKNPEASSGILGHAIGHYKKVVAPKQGLIGKLVQDFQMGIPIPVVNPENIAEAIINLEDYSIDEHKYSKFNMNHSPEIFAKTLLWI